MTKPLTFGYLKKLEEHWKLLPVHKAVGPGWSDVNLSFYQSLPDGLRLRIVGKFWGKPMSDDIPVGLEFSTRDPLDVLRDALDRSMAGIREQSLADRPFAAFVKA